MDSFDWLEEVGIDVDDEDLMALLYIGCFEFMEA